LGSFRDFSQLLRASASLRGLLSSFFAVKNILPRASNKNSPFTCVHGEFWEVLGSFRDFSQLLRASAFLRGLLSFFFAVKNILSRASNKKLPIHLCPWGVLGSFGEFWGVLGSFGKI